MKAHITLAAVVFWAQQVSSASLTASASINYSATDSTFDAEVDGYVRFYDWGEQPANSMVTSGFWTLSVYEPAVFMGEDAMPLIALTYDNGLAPASLSLGLWFYGGRYLDLPNYRFGYFVTPSGEQIFDQICYASAPVWKTPETFMELFYANEEGGFNVRIRAQPAVVPEPSALVFLAAGLAALFALHQRR